MSRPGPGMPRRVQTSAGAGTENNTPDGAVRGQGFLFTKSNVESRMVDVGKRGAVCGSCSLSAFEG